MGDKYRGADGPLARGALLAWKANSIQIQLNTIKLKKLKGARDTRPIYLTPYNT